jgi:hypothetical protein
MQVFLTKMLLLQKKATNRNHQGMLKVILRALTAAKVWFNGDWHWCNQIIWLISVQWLASAIDLLMCVVENCLSLCCSSVCFYFESERFRRKWFLPGKKRNGKNSCTRPPSGGQATMMVTMWAMAMGIMLASNEEGKCEGGKGNGNGNEGSKQQRGWRRQDDGNWQWQQGWWASNGDGNKEGNGDGDNSSGQAMATATKRAMARAMRVAADKEGNGNGSQPWGQQ